MPTAMTCVGLDAALKNVAVAPEVVMPAAMAVAGEATTTSSFFIPGTAQVSPLLATVTVASTTRLFPKTAERCRTTVTAAIIHLPLRVHRCRHVQIDRDGRAGAHSRALADDGYRGSGPTSDSIGLSRGSGRVTHHPVTDDVGRS